MRKIVATELVSLDGVMESPEEWAFSYSNDEMAEANASGMAEADAMVFGSVTYQDSTEQPFTDYLNNSRKYVVSTTLEGPLEWQNSTLMVPPIILGRGKRLFDEAEDQRPLELVDSKTFETGVVYLTYRPAQG